MRRLMLAGVVWLLTWWGSADGQGCPAVIGSTCTFPVNRPIGPYPLPERFSAEFAVTAGWVIESAKLVPLAPGWKARITAKVAFNQQVGVAPGGPLAAVNRAIATTRTRLQARPLVTPLGERLPGDPGDWVLRPLTSTQDVFQALGTELWPTVFRVEASFDPKCAGCFYTFQVQVTARYIGWSNQDWQPLLQQVGARLDTLPRPIQLVNRCAAPVSLRVAVYRGLTDGIGSRFSDAMTVASGERRWVTTAADKPPLTWMPGWRLAVQLTSDPIPRTLKGRMIVGEGELWDGRKNVKVFLWPDRLEQDLATIVLCPA